MNKDYIGKVPEFYQGYVKLVDTTSDIVGLYALEQLIWWKTNLDRLEEKGDYAYAEGKWTIKQLIQHMIDTERIFVYRALAACRGEDQELPGYDEDEYALNGKASHRSVQDLMEEWDVVRQSSFLFFNTLIPSDWSKVVKANQKQISVAAIAYILIGHEIHHQNIIEERYLNL